MLSTAIIAEAGRSVVAAGNVGPNALGELEKHRLAGTLPDFWVLELSSFQLETTESLHCDSAALLNITEDHIDWHGSMEKYAAAKRKIFSADTVRVLNREDPGSMLSAEGVRFSTYLRIRCAQDNRRFRNLGRRRTGMALRLHCFSFA